METSPTGSALPPPLEHGARRVLEAQPFRIDVHGQNTRWTCTNCRRAFPLRDSWAVEVEARARPVRFVVCPQCASSFRLPTAMIIDLVRFRSAEPTAVALRGFLEKVEEIARLRNESHRDRVTVRATDIRAFASAHGIAAPALARLLAIEGLGAPLPESG